MIQAKIIGENPYASVICNYFQRSFPGKFNLSSTDKLELLTTLIVGTKEVRYGPIPSPELLVNIRKVLKDAIEKNLPIPVLIPWGGRKTDPSSPIDIAEVSGLNQVLSVDTAIRAIYSPGLQVNMRIEDINALWLYRGDPDLERNVMRYSEDMETLVHMMRGDSSITPMREVSMMDKEQYFATSMAYSEKLFQTIMAMEENPSYKMGDIAAGVELKSMGWKGELGKEQREYYMGRYKHLYNASTEQAATMLADYFAGSKARYDLGAKGIPYSEVRGFIQVNFAHPVPGAPVGLFDTTVHWRTIPMSQGRTHIAPWRGKGYLRVGGETTAKITSWNDQIVPSLIPSKVHLISKDQMIEVETDYLIEQ